MISDKFRHQLRVEVNRWRAEGIIDNSVYEQLADRYQFNNLDIASRNRFLAILIGLGGILLGLGVITFVAANWQEWPREGRVVLLLSVFVLVNAVGFYLWRTPLSPSRLARGNQGIAREIPPAAVEVPLSIQPTSKPGWQKRLGHGLLLLGSLSLGANMALMAQMFHIGGSPYGLYLVWGLGVLVMAYSLRLTSLGVLALLLTSWGYWLGVFDWSSKQEFSGLQVLIDHWPAISSLIFVPLAYWCRSRVIFAIAAIATIFSLEVTLLPLWNLGWAAAIACTLPTALLWGYDDLMWPNVRSRYFQPLARSLGLLFLTLLFYVISFHGVWESSSYRPETLEKWTRLLDVGLLGGLAAVEWMRLGYLKRKRPTRQGIDLNSNAIAIFLGVSAFIPLLHLNLRPIPVLATIAFNVLLFLLAIALVRGGLNLGERKSFWVGMVLITLQILSRTFEYETGLLLKSLVFVLCGLGMIAAGLWFERYFAKVRPQS